MFFVVSVVVFIYVSSFFCLLVHLRRLKLVLRDVVADCEGGKKSSV